MASGILTTPDEDERRLGFQHQTVFDFALARSFASEGQTLSSFVIERQQSLFVRPRLWSALVYLRGAETQTYRGEFRDLWQRPDLRYHVRLQLVEFLGQIEDPDFQEETFFRAALADPTLRETALAAMVGRRKWFERLAPDALPQMMAGDGAIRRTLAEVLGEAMKHSPTIALRLLRERWLPLKDADWWTAMVLRNLKPWSDEATKIAEVLASRDHALESHLFDLIAFASETDARFAVPIFAALMNRKVAGVEAQSAIVVGSGGEASIPFLFNQSARQHAANEVLQGNADWPDLKPIAETAPAAFIENRFGPFFCASCLRWTRQKKLATTPSRGSMGLD